MQNKDSVKNISSFFTNPLRIKHSMVWYYNAEPCLKRYSIPAQVFDSSFCIKSLSCNILKVNVNPMTWIDCSL
uniref:Uncharacterized protein n=1 Tax=Rhizophora mucronata TaxID=61149 RepID=A0A2P2J3F8_RHIMU